MIEARESEYEAPVGTFYSDHAHAYTYVDEIASHGAHVTLGAENASGVTVCVNMSCQT